jgi:hypothetical protein
MKLSDGGRWSTEYPHSNAGTGNIETHQQELLSHISSHIPIFPHSKLVARSFFAILTRSGIREKLRNGWSIEFHSISEENTDREATLVISKLLAKRDWISYYYLVTPSPQIEGCEAFNWQGQDGIDKVRRCPLRTEDMKELVRSVRSTSNCRVRGCELCLLSPSILSWFKFKSLEIVPWSLTTRIVTGEYTNLTLDQVVSLLLPIYRMTLSRI